MHKYSGKPLTEDERRDLDVNFLEGTREGIALDIARMERGEMPKDWGGGPSPPESVRQEVLEGLRAFHRQAGEAIDHVRAGGALDETPAILWGREK